MIIIKIIILYFIQIRHTDNFPLTGTRQVIYNYTVIDCSCYVLQIVGNLVLLQHVHECELLFGLFVRCKAKKLK